LKLFIAYNDIRGGFVLAENLNVSDFLPGIPSTAGQLDRKPKQQQLDQLSDLQQLLAEQLRQEAEPAQPWNIRHIGLHSMHFFMFVIGEIRDTFSNSCALK
jgi:hypothetical protein